MSGSSITMIITIINQVSLTAVLVGSLLTLAVTNSICNQFHFDSCSCQLYVNLSCELMVCVTSFTLTAVLVSCMLTLAVS